MQDFGKLLHSYLKDHHSYSISAFAKEIGISAGLLNHIFNGKRTMSTDKFLLTINSAVFDLNEREKLRDAYFIERYGEKDYKKIRLICDTVQNFNFGSASEIEDCTDIISKGFGELLSGKEVFSAIKELFASTDSVIYTNIHHSNNSINHILYKLKKDFASSQMVRFVPAFSAKVTEKSLTTLFSIIRFAKIGVNTVSLENIEVEHLEKTTLFPYFVISDKMLILLDSRCKKGVAFCGGEIAADKYRVTENASKSAKSVIRYFKNELEAVNYIINFENDKIFTLKSTPCFLAVDDLDYLYKADSDYPDKNDFISFLKHRRTDKQWFNICTQAGFEEFIETGKTYELSEVFVKSFPIEARKMFLRSMINTLEKDEVYHNAFFDRSVNFSEFFAHTEIVVYDNSCIITTIPDEPDGSSFLSQITLHITGGEFLKICKILLSDYLPISGQLLTKQTALHYLKGIEIELQRRSE